jgi:hypothetical protein
MPNWKHQEIALARYADKEYFGLLFDCGTGKTRTAVMIAEAKEMNNTVIAPKNLRYQWLEALVSLGVDKDDIFVLDAKKLKTKKGRAAFEKFVNKP